MKTFLTNISTQDKGHPSEIDFICDIRLIECHKHMTKISYAETIDDILSMTIVTKDNIYTMYPNITSKDTLVFNIGLSLEDISTIEYIGITTITSDVSLEV